MGQRIGKASFVDEGKSFVNLSSSAITAIWDRFNIIADNWGLSEAQFVRIVCEIAPDLEMDSATLDPIARDAFRMFDTDNNGIVDALESIAAMAMASGMEPADKIKFVFNCYDFSESKLLSAAEVTLSLKSTTTGLTKMSGALAPSLPEIEQLVKLAFAYSKVDPGTGKLSDEEFAGYCTTNPAISSWIDYFDDVLIVGEKVVDMVDEDVQFEGSAAVACEARPAMYAALRNNDDVSAMLAAQEAALQLEAEADPDFSAVKPWQVNLEASTPTEPPVEVAGEPDANLRLEWVHGYRAQDSRNNLRYTKGGEVVYPAAAVGVVYTHADGGTLPQQRFNMSHCDDVLCLTMHPDGVKVATGEMGSRPSVVVWDSTTGVALATLTGYHRRAVLHVAFSPDGRYLATVGQDDQYSVAVYDWEARRLVFSSRNTQQKVLGLAWTGPRRFATCGVDHVTFWTAPNGWTSTRFRKKKGLFGRKGKIQPVLCIAPVAGSSTDPAEALLVAGTVSGHLYLFRGRNVVQAVKAHGSSVTALFSHAAGMVSGGKDGKVRLWDAQLHPGPSMSMSNVPSVIDPAVRSVCLSPDGSKVLVGTRSSAIHELSTALTELGSDVNGKALIEGHFRDELWGLACHPTKNEFATVGDDATVRVWEIGTRRQLRLTSMDAVARAVCYAPTGQFIAVGLGARIEGAVSSADAAAAAANPLGGEEDDDKEVVPPALRKGTFVVLNDVDLSVVHLARPGTEAISDLKFSPDGSTLAVASLDGKIYLHDTSDWSLKFTCSGHSNPVTHFDFSADGTYIQSTCAGFELLYFATDSGEPGDAGALKDTEWASQNCALGYSVQGIWSKGMESVGINSVDLSRRSNLLVTADDYGFLKLFRYPTVTPDKAGLTYRGHAAHVTTVRFNSAGSYVLSLGGSDRCVFQWLVDVDNTQDSGAEPDAPGEPGSSDGEEMLDGEGLDRDDTQTARNTDDMSIVYEMEAAKAGEEFMAVKPWQSAVFTPFDAPIPDPKLPEADLELEWVHGYRAQDARSNVMYSPSGDVVYTAASVGIVFNKELWRQSFNRQHTDDVVCMARHPDGIHVATGQMGRFPMVVVWNTQTCETVQTLTCRSVRAISALAFSPNGVQLAAVGQDDGHTVFVYDWAAGRLSCCGKGGSKKVLALCFMNNNTTLVQAGVDHFKMWNVNGTQMTGRRGIFGKKTKVQPVLSVAAVGDGALMGLLDGTIVRVPMDDRKVDGIIGAHERAVNTIYVGVGGVATGSRDGTIKVFTSDLEPRCDITMAPFCGKRSPAVRSVCLRDDGRVLLVGTRASEIFEIDITGAEDVEEGDIAGVDINLGPLVSGHFRGELWGLATHPSKAEYVTVGDDRTVRVWCVVTHKLLRSATVDSMGRAVAYSPGGTHIVVGLGAANAKKQKKAGTYVVLNESDLTEVRSGRDTKQAVSDIKFSPDGTIMALGSHDNFIYLYNVADGYSLRATCDKHTSYITHLDFDKDGAVLQSNCGAYELLYFDAQTGDHKPNSSDFASQEWDTTTCPLTWAAQGVWPQYSDGTDVNAVDRSKNRAHMVSADAYGKVKLFRFPASVQGAQFKESSGHSSAVTNVRFGHDDGVVVSTGGNDRAVFQWRVVDDGGDEAGAAVAGDSGEDSDLGVSLADGDAVTAESLAGSNALFAIDADIEGGDFGDKPWVSAVEEPSAPPLSNPAAPRGTMDLEFVHGYRCGDARSNLFYNADGDLVYSAAGVGVVYARSEHAQKFYSGHDGDVLCVAISPDKRFVATGQSGKDPLVHVWDACTGAQVCVLPRFHRRAVSQLAFSPDGRLLASIGEDDHHSLALWSSASGEWTDGKRIAGAKNDTRKVLFVEFTGLDDFPIVTGGVKHVRFWSTGGRRLVSRRGVFGEVGKLQPILSAAVVNGQVVTGTVSGHLYVWSGCTVVRAVRAHTKSVNTMYVGCGQLVTGGKDGMVKLWSRSMEVVRSFNLSEASPAPTRSSVRSVCLNEAGTRVLVGTRGAEIYEYILDSGLGTLLAEGHCDGELWGLAVNPKYKDLYATAGDDGTVRVWSVRKRRMVKKVNVGYAARSIAWDPAGRTLAIGLGAGEGGDKDGGFMLIDGDAMDVMMDAREAKAWIHDVKFSPDGATLAVASHDNVTYLHDVTAGCSLRAKADKHSSPVTHVDFSADGGYLRSNCGGFELMYFQAADGEQEADASVLKDTAWASDTCPFGYAVQGIWGEESGGSISAVDRSASATLLATADDGGRVKLFNYPCVVKGASSLVGTGHASVVTNVRFAGGDSNVVSTGGADRCVFQWRVAVQGGDE